MLFKSIAYLHLTFFISIIFAQNEAELDYYERLVNSNIEEILNYTVIRNADQFRPVDNNILNYGQYDFIVIGGGAGGSVVASRLTENENWNVLLLEAGQYETNFTDIPSMYFYLAKSPYNWGYESVPQKYACLGMKKKQCPYIRGRGMGGTTLLNGLVYTRGNREDYYEWAEGSPGWNYSDVLPFYKYSENSHINGDTGYHSTDGPVNVEYNQIYSPQLDAYLRANQELGRPIIDYNGRRQLGVSKTQMIKIHGSRLSSARAYLRPIINERSNLEISNGSYVIEILTRRSNNSLKAYGVKFTKNGQIYVATARKEVIVSAGSIATPQILMLSGIGPIRELTKHNIPVKVNLEVGRNLHDHTTFYGINVLTNYSEPIRSLREYLRLYLRGRGPFSVPGNNQGLGFIQTRYAKYKGVPDIEVMMIPSNRTNPVYQEFMNYDDETFNAITSVIDDIRTFIIYVILLRPKSIGTVTLNSNDPYEYPVINPKFFSESIDLDVVYEGVQLVKKMLNTDAFRSINATLRIAKLPGCSRYKYLSKKYMKCFIRYTSMNIYHPVGTCKMGPLRDGGVVDNKLRVHGVKNLRVIDGSAIPFALKAHPSAPIMMLAEKGSCFIKSQYNDNSCSSIV